MNWVRQWVEVARETLDSGYYRNRGELRYAPSLVKALGQAQALRDPAIVADVRPSTLNLPRAPEGGMEGLLRGLLDEGACALSVTPEPRFALGTIAHLKAAVSLRVPVLMDDILLSEQQVDFAANVGASAVLLRPSLLPRSRVGVLVEAAHLAEREVVTLCQSKDELEAALASETDLVGVENRDPATGAVDVRRAQEWTRGLVLDRPVMAFHAFTTPQSIRELKGVAHAAVVEPEVHKGRASLAGLLAPVLE